MTEEVKTPEQEEQEYNDLFKEMSAGVLEDTDEEDVKDQEEEKEPDAGTEQPDDEGDDGEKSPKEPEKEPESKQEPKPDDWREALPDEAKQHLDRIERDARITRHRLKSDEGRVSALQKKINKIQDELEAARSNSAPAEEELPDIEIPEELKDFAKNYPQVADFVTAVTKQGMKAVKPAAAPADKGQPEAPAQQEAEAEEQLTEEEAKLLHDGLVREGVGNYQDIIKHPVFNEFLDSQPDHISRLYNSTDLGDLVALFKDYWDPYVHQRFPQEEPKADVDSAKNEAASSETTKADEATQRRESALKDTAVDSRQSRNEILDSAETDDSYDALFKKQSQKKRKELLGQGF